MRYAHMYIDRGSGWENLTPHGNAAAALADFSLAWGTTSATTQPDPNVLSLTLFDRDGQLSGKALSLAGARILLQLTRTPTWADLNSEAEWQGQPESLTWAGFADAYEPLHDQAPDPMALNLFTGRVSTGGTVKQQGDHWTLSLYATADTVLLKRSTTRGPASADAKLAGYHWTGTPATRLAELAKRAAALGAPPLDTKAAANYLPPAVQPYASDSFPDLKTILEALTAASPAMPLWFERHAHGSDRLAPVPMASPAAIILHSDGHISARAGGVESDAVPAGQLIIGDPSLTLPDPLTGVTLATVAVKWSDTDEKLSYEAAEIAFTDMGLLPAALTASQNTVSVGSDAISSDQSEGHYSGPVLAPSQADRLARAAWLKASDMRLRPTNLTADTRHVSPDRFEQIFTPTASGPWAFVTNRYTRLLADDGSPATSGAWMAIGGTLTYRFVGGKPVLTNELTMSPLPAEDSQLATWGALGAVDVAWEDLGFTWAELGQITRFEQ